MQQRLKKLIKPGHGHAGLRRVADGPQDPPGRAGPPYGLIDECCLADACRSPDQDGGARLPVGQAGGDQGLLGVPPDEQAAVSIAVRSRHK
jgi:hypothetical protein